jgi:hypothetical protein
MTDQGKWQTAGARVKLRWELNDLKHEIGNDARCSENQEQGHADGGGSSPEWRDQREEPCCSRTLRAMFSQAVCGKNAR